ncbi:MAG TPA: protein kinase [Polyangiaceae bacterium]|nr:protein kinase [Polyangiaceae bacterium]
MGRRLALVVSADSGSELSGGKRDAMRVFSVLADENLGACDPESPQPIAACSSRARFHEAWHSLLTNWNPQDQLLFYFSGHGVMKHGRYTLAFGAAPSQHYVPFDHLTSDLQAHGVRRAVVILDACHSGAALQAGAKGTDGELPIQTLPAGIVVLTSCRSAEQSFEFEDGAGSVFTHLLTQGIRSGLGGKPTPDGLIGPDDLVEYINTRLAEPEYANYPQRPSYQVSSADRTVWIARNRSVAPAEARPKVATRAYSIEQLHLLYDRTEKTRHPCPGATLDCLDWDLVAQYAEASRTPLESTESTESRDQAARRLGLYSSLSDDVLHNAAVLCFARAPHALLQQGRALYLRGERSSTHALRTDVLGPLSQQVRELTQLVMTDVYRRWGWRPTDPTATLLAETVREAVSNAVAHRDYDRSELVRVSMRDDCIEITNPGAFPRGTTFESLLAAGNYSEPNDAAIAWYLTTLLAYEGVGRGFSVYNAFRAAAGDNALECHVQAELRSIRLVLRIPTQIAPQLAPVPEKTEPPAAVPTGPGTLHGLGRDVVFGEPIHSTVAQPNLIPRTGTEELVGQRYRLGPTIGTGASGTVFLAEDTRLARQVAVKVLSKRFVTAEVRERFLQEAKLAARVVHPNVVAVYDVGEETDRLYIVMELVTGDNLDATIRGSERLREREPDLFFLQAAWLIYDLAAALAAAHASLIIHRDIKPSNVIVEQSGSPRLLDFGVSRAASRDTDSRLTATGVLVGTPYYMSPEQVRGEIEDERSDIYSLGVVMYELLCGRLPFEAQALPSLFIDITQGDLVQPRRHAPRIPVELESICLRAMQRERVRRYPQADSMALELRQYLPSNPCHRLYSQDRAKLWADFKARLDKA